jgi:tripartite-type tricarboxylate transporter receptor subunit TctC
MSVLHRGVLAAALAVGFVAATNGLAQSEKNYPNKPIRLIVPFSAGAGVDIMARIGAQKLSESWGQHVVLENRSGGGGRLGAAIVAKAQPDGYTLLWTSSAFTISAALFKGDLPYDPIKDFAGVTQIGFSTSALVVPPSLGVRTVKELIALANAKPGQILFSSSGAGIGVHMSTERFKLAAGIKATHVAFKSSAEATIEAMTGRVHFSIPPLGPSLPFIKDGKLLALAVTNPQRSPLLPDVPAMVEVVPAFQRDGSFGLLAPAGTPRPILNQISRDVARAFEHPDVKQKLQAMGFVAAPTTPEEFDRIIRADIETFRKVGKLVGLIAP